MDGLGELDPDTSITQSHDGNREWGVSYGVENSNDFSDRVETRSRSLIVIGVRHHIGRIHIVEHDLIGCE